MMTMFVLVAQVLRINKDFHPTVLYIGTILLDLYLIDVLLR